jgi:hypothetical protein
MALLATRGRQVPQFGVAADLERHGTVAEGFPS